MEAHSNIIFFDGPCNLCNQTVKFIIKRDKDKQYHFSSLQSEFATRFLSERQIGNQYDTILFYSDGIIYRKSRAIQKILRRLGWKCRILSFLLQLTPLFISDYAYDFISKRRYWLFGKNDSCEMMSKEMQQQVLID